MNGIWVVLSVAGLFLVRIGLPVLMLVILGILIDRWQSKRLEEGKTQQRILEVDFKRWQEEANGEDQNHKAA